MPIADDTNQPVKKYSIPQRSPNNTVIICIHRRVHHFNIQNRTYVYKAYIYLYIFVLDILRESNLTVSLCRKFHKIIFESAFIVFYMDVYMF